MNGKTKKPLIKKRHVCFAIISVLSSTAAYADYELTVNNNSVVPLIIAPQGKNKINVPAKKSMKLSLSTGRNVAIQYQQSGYMAQNMAYLDRPTTTFGVQGTPFETSAPGRQSLKVKINGGKGSFITGPGNHLSGICKADGAGFWCPTNTSDHGGALTLDVSGGQLPPPTPNYVTPTYPDQNDQVKAWESGVQYGQWNKGNLKSRVKYNGQEWVCCSWINDTTKNPEETYKTQGWKIWEKFDPSKNVCNN
ncbi:hypothetical protein [Facilibium subflavum]|uniref:hypothetical protein n=1 Tax=Facilibium subflavum TaxID=2219058 RepID=UPI000E64B264|nr:hypothetical protein [Facilibium subflavum]